MRSAFTGDVVPNSELAARIGDILCDALYRELAEQKPLITIDEGGYWRVEGSRNRDGAIDGPAEFFLSIKKSDARVTDIGEHLRFKPHPSVVPLIHDHFSKKFDATPQNSDPPQNSAGNRKIGDTNVGMLLLTEIARGGVIFSGELAIKIAELLCEAHFDDLSRQRPLTVMDNGSYWQIEGNWNRDRKGEDGGPFFLSIQKYDGRVNEMGE